MKLLHYITQFNEKIRQKCKLAYNPVRFRDKKTHVRSSVFSCLRYREIGLAIEGGDLTNVFNYLAQTWFCITLPVRCYQQQQQQQKQNASSLVSYDTNKVTWHVLLLYTTYSLWLMFATAASKALYISSKGLHCSLQVGCKSKCNGLVFMAIISYVSYKSL